MDLYNSQVTNTKGSTIDNTTRNDDRRDNSEGTPNEMLVENSQNYLQLSNTDHQSEKLHNKKLIGNFTPCLSLKKDLNPVTLKSCMREMELFNSRQDRIFHPPRPALPKTDFQTIPSSNGHKRNKTDLPSFNPNSFNTVEMDNFYHLKNGQDYYLKRLSKVSCRKLEKIFKPVINQQTPYIFPSISFHSSTLSTKKNSGMNAPFAFTRLNQRSISEYKTSNINSERAIHG